MRIDLPKRPSIEIWRASECNLPMLLEQHPAGLKGIVGVGDQEFFVWARDRVDHGMVAKKLGITIQVHVDCHREPGGDFAVVRAVGGRELQYQPWQIDWEAIGYPVMRLKPIDYPIHEWLVRRYFEYVVTLSVLQVWKRPL